jgi:hypothetical protein
MIFGNRLVILLTFGLFVFCPHISIAQEYARFGTNSSISAMQSYSPNSEHILVGTSTGRKSEQAGFGYSHQLKRWSSVVFSYEGWLLPLYVESDPTFGAISTPNVNNPGGAPTITPLSTPFRPIWLGQILGYVSPPLVIGGYTPSYPVTGIPGPRELTYASGALPIGFRITGFAKLRIQPTFAVNLGALYATRNIPVDYTSSFNFLTQAGPGVEIFVSKRASVRVEYLYDHLSNANLGATNPGLDSAAVRLSFNRYR